MSKWVNRMKRYLPCDTCKVNCCKRIGDGMTVAPEEIAVESQMDDQKHFYKLKDCGGCSLLTSDERCEIYALRPFMCQAYPFSIASGKLFVDEGCPYLSTFVEGLKIKNPNVMEDLPTIKAGLEATIPLAIREMWQKEHDRGKRMGFELPIPGDAALTSHSSCVQINP